MKEFFAQLGPIGDSLLTFVSALLILLVGYIAARLIASGVRRLLERTNVDNRLADALSEGKTTQKYDIEDLIGKVIFWIIMLFVFVGVLQRLNLPAVANPINALLQRVTTEYLPSLGGALLLLALAWAIATILRLLVSKGLGLLKVDERLAQHGALEEGEQVSITNSLATAVFWFIFLLFLPAVLSQFGISQVAEPLQEIFRKILGYLPNVLGAAVILLVGWFIARIIRQIVSNLLLAVGADRLGQRIGLRSDRSLSQLLGTVLYTFIMLFTIVSALEELNIAAISDPATLMLTTLINTLPNIFGAALVLIVSYFIGRLVAGLLTDMFSSMGFDSVPQRLGIAYNGSRSPSQLVGYLILVAIMLFAAVSASELLGSTFLSTILSAFVSFLGQVVLALVIFSIGLYLANLARSVILSAGGSQANLTANMARLAVLVLAGAMGLRQLGVADDIVNLAFGIMLGALGVAVALAFGLGSRDIAGREVERFLGSIRTGGTDAE